MSFSFTAGGTLEETKASLNSDSLAHMSGDGERTRQLVLSFLENVPEAGGDGTPLRFDVSAYGHHNDAGGSLPSLSITLTCKYVQPDTAAPAGKDDAPDPEQKASEDLDSAESDSQDDDEDPF